MALPLSCQSTWLVKGWLTASQRPCLSRAEQHCAMCQFYMCAIEYLLWKSIQVFSWECWQKCSASWSSVHTDDVVAKTMKVIAPGGRLHQWAALCMSHRCIHTTGRQRSVARLSVVDPERARLLTSFYYQGAIDKAANKVCILSLSWMLFYRSLLYLQIEGQWMNTLYNSVVIST